MSGRVGAVTQGYASRPERRGARRGPRVRGRAQGPCHRRASARPPVARRAPSGVTPAGPAPGSVRRRDVPAGAGVRVRPGDGAVIEVEGGVPGTSGDQVVVRLAQAGWSRSGRSRRRRPRGAGVWASAQVGGRSQSGPRQRRCSACRGPRSQAGRVRMVRPTLVTRQGPMVSTAVTLACRARVRARSRASGPVKRSRGPDRGRRLPGLGVSAPSASAAVASACPGSACPAPGSEPPSLSVAQGSCTTAAWARPTAVSRSVRSTCPSASTGGPSGFG